MNDFQMRMLVGRESRDSPGRIGDCSFTEKASRTSMEAVRLVLHCT